MEMMSRSSLAGVGSGSGGQPHKTATVKTTVKWPSTTQFASTSTLLASSEMPPSHSPVAGTGSRLCTT